MTTSYSVNQSTQGTNPPPKMQVGMYAAIAAFVAFAQTTNALITAFDTMLTTFSQALTKIGQDMNTQLKTDANALQTDANNGASQVQVTADSDTYQNDTTKYQNEMTPYNTQTDSWTDGVKQLSSDESNFFQYCQGPIQILTNLSGRL